MLHSLKVAPKHLAEYSIGFPNIHQSNNHLSELTTTGVGEDINTVKSILQETRMGSPDVTRVDKHIIEQNRDSLTDHLKRNLKVLADIVAVITIYGLSFFDTGIKMLHSLKEAPIDLAEYSIANIRQLFNRLPELTATDVVKSILQETRMGSPDVTRDFNNFNSTIEKIKENDVARKDVENVFALSDKIQTGKHMDNKRNMNMLESNLNQLTAKSVQHTTESAQHTMNVAIIVANRSFLIEEINTMALVRAFQDQGITCFDGLDGTLEGQQSAEGFLTILEEKNLLDHLLAILREEGMTYVLDRLNNCRNAYSADPQILRTNISNNHTNILDNLDIDDVREIFIERGVFSSSMFDEIEKKCSESENQMNAVLIEIKTSGPRAMRTLVDVLYIINSDSLADSLLMGTPNELQEIQDNIQID